MRTVECRRWWWASAVAGAVLCHAVVTGRVSAAPGTGEHPLYLPFVAQMPEREPCGQPVGDPCAASESRNWEVVCGGFGRLRDMVIPTPGSTQGMLRAVTIGDGVAVVEVLPAPVAGTPPAVQWRPQIGAAFTGLNALSIDVGADVAGIEAWAVGDRDHIVSRVAGCWRREAPGIDTAGIDLKAVHANAPEGGWAVGYAGAAGHEVGVMRFLMSPEPGLEPEWVDYRITPMPPPLSDVAFNHADATGTPDAWAVGYRDGEGIFLHGRPGASGYWRWTEAVRRPGKPRELTVRAAGNEGWSFGNAEQDGVAGLAAWYYERNGALWERDPSFFEPDRDLVDMYTEGRRGGERLWVGISPAGDKPVLAYLDLDSRLWSRLGLPPDEMPASGNNGSRAIAPDSGTRVLYAWADDVWLYQQPTPGPTARSGEPTPTAVPAPDAAAWSLVHRSRALAGFLPMADGTGWAITDDGPAAASTLLTYRDGAFQALAESPRRLTAMAGNATEAWAIGEAGATLHLHDGLWRALPSEPPVDGDFLAVALAPDGDVWAAGVGRDGLGRLWQRARNASGWLERARTTGRTPLRSVTALANGNAWAVGDGCVAVQPVAGSNSGRISIPCAGNTDPVDLAAVAAMGRDAVWAGGSVFVYRWDGRAWQVMRAPGGGTALGFMAQDEHLVALAAAAPDDVWGIYQAAYPRGREASTVIQLTAGEWRRRTLLNVPLRDLRLVDGPPGTRTLWLAGDGATVARLRLAAR